MTYERGQNRHYSTGRILFSEAYFREKLVFKGREREGLIRGENFICVFKWAGTADKKGYKHSKPTA